MGMHILFAQTQKQVDKCEIYLAISSLVLYSQIWIHLSKLQLLKYRFWRHITLENVNCHYLGNHNG